MMSKWEMVRLGDVCKVVNGYAFDSKLFNAESKGQPIIRIRDVVRGYTETYTTEKCKDIHIVRSDDLIIGMDGEFNISTWKSDDALLNQRVCRLDIHECSVAAGYVLYCLPKKLKEIEDATPFVTVKHLSSKTIENIIIPLPPLSVQQKIADILDRTVALIEKRKAQIAKLDLLVKSQFIEMFGDPVINPMGWEVKRLGDLVKVRSSKRVYQREQTTSGVPFLRISDLVDKIAYNLDTNDLYISDELYDIFLKDGVVPNVGDILVTSRGSLGLCYVVNEHDRFYFQDGMISWLNKRDDIIDSIYLSYLFLSSEIKRQIGIASAGSTVHYLSLTHLENFSILYPPLELQKKFAEFVKRINYHKTTFNMQKAHLDMLYKSLTQKCFSGS